MFAEKGDVSPLYVLSDANRHKLTGNNSTDTKALKGQTQPANGRNRVWKSRCGFFFYKRGK